MAGREGRAARIRGAALAAALTLALAAGIIRGFAGSRALFLRGLERFAPAERTGLPAAEYPGMAAHIADYLAGRKDDFQYTLALPGGGAAPCFHDYELAHMADCRGLIRLDGFVCLGSAALALAAAVLIRRRKDPFSETFRGARFALLGLGAAAAGLAAWAAADFDGLFVTFHRAAFSNDLWLLDPRTDLLIRLMPESLFTDLGILGLAAFTLGMGAFLSMLMLLRRRNQ